MQLLGNVVILPTNPNNFLGSQVYATPCRPGEDDTP